MKTSYIREGSSPCFCSPVLINRNGDQRSQWKKDRYAEKFCILVYLPVKEADHKFWLSFQCFSPKHISDYNCQYKRSRRRVVDRFKIRASRNISPCSKPLSSRDSWVLYFFRVKLADYPGNIQLFWERLSYKRAKAYATMSKVIMGNGGFFRLLEWTSRCFSVVEGNSPKWFLFTRSLLLNRL